MEYEQTMLPCPFCGSNACISIFYDSVLAHCRGCDCFFIENARGMSKEDAKRRVIEKWNRRVSDD